MEAREYPSREGDISYFYLRYRLSVVRERHLRVGGSVYPCQSSFDPILLRLEAFASRLSFFTDRRLLRVAVSMSNLKIFYKIMRALHLFFFYLDF